MWDFYRRTQFLKQFKNLDSETKKRVIRALTVLSYSENPSDFGVYKQNMRVFAYNVGKYRILYSIRYAENIIDLIRVCDHKSVYTKD
jgi:mRNA-degrading endonuclease RelE of RelBE toxin-antitoxin system